MSHSPRLDGCLRVDERRGYDLPRAYCSLDRCMLYHGVLKHLLQIVVDF